MHERNLEQLQVLIGLCHAYRVVVRGDVVGSGKGGELFLKVEVILYVFKRNAQTSVFVAEFALHTRVKHFVKVGVVPIGITTYVVAVVERGSFVANKGVHV